MNPLERLAKIDSVDIVEAQEAIDVIRNNTNFIYSRWIDVIQDLINSVKGDQER